MPDDLSWKEKLLAAQTAGSDVVEMSMDEITLCLSRLDWIT